jgi:hypothetical protein
LIRCARLRKKINKKSVKIKKSFITKDQGKAINGPAFFVSMEIKSLVINKWFSPFPMHTSTRYLRFGQSVGIAKLDADSNLKLLMACEIMD